jgi:ribonucleoside-diphosphate reductase beta chain
LNLYKHINSPEARLYLSRQLFEEAVHVQFYLNLLDTYIPDEEERFEAFTSIESIPSIHQKAQFSFKWIESLYEVDTLKTHEDRKNFLMNLICFGGCIEGLFFYGAFAYVYYLRSRGLLNGLASGTNWVFRDESMHMAFAFMVIKRIREEDPTLFDVNMQERIKVMLKEAVDSEIQFAHDLLKDGVSGLSIKDMSNYIKYVADKRLEHFGIKPIYNTKNPLKFMELQDIQELSNFFERKVSAYQLGVTGEVNLNEDF